MTVSSRDFQNAYEKFYNEMRKYLWSYQVLCELGAVEDNIYSSFINRSKLENDFAKLKSSTKEVYKEDKEFAKHADQLQELIDMKDADPYCRIFRVNETNQEKVKTLKTVPEKGE